MIGMIAFKRMLLSSFKVEYDNRFIDTVRYFTWSNFSSSGNAILLVLFITPVFSSPLCKLYIWTQWHKSAHHKNLIVEIPRSKSNKVRVIIVKIIRACSEEHFPDVQGYVLPTA